MIGRQWKVLVFALTILFSTTALINSNGGGYKCLIQLKNYQGEGAYIIVSVVDAQGKYIETLNVLGDDKEWYPDIFSWWKHREQVKHQPRIDGITGSTIGSGERKIISLKIDSKYVDKGYQLRFETAVEDKEYFEKDIQVALSSQNLKQGKFDGKDGYIRMVRLIPLGK